MSKLIQDMKLSRKLLLAPLIIIACLILLSAVSFMGLSSQKEALKDLYKNRFKQSQESARVINELTQVHANIYKVMSWAGANFDPARVDKLGKEQMAIIERNIATLQKWAQARSNDEAGKKKLQNLIESVSDYKKSVAETVDLSTVDIGMANTFMSTAENKFQRLNGNLQEFLNSEEKLSVGHFTTLLASFDKMLVLLGVGILLALVFSMFISLRVNRNILNSLGGEPAYVVEIARAVSQGDLTLKIDTDENNANSLLAVVKNMVGSLNRMVGKVDKSTNELSLISTNLTSAASQVVVATHVQGSGISETSSAIGQISGSLKEVAVGVDNLSRSAAESSASIMEMAGSVEEVALNMETLTQSVEEVSSSILQMSFTIRQVSGGVNTLLESSTTTALSVSEMDNAIKQVKKHASETAVITDSVRKDAERGRFAVEATISGIEKIRSSSQITSEVIGTLSLRVGDIGTILSVIDDVAEQTNLLALNAAIIAAQAGEHGKGFAVVAAEIKELSERTSSSTRKISKVIKGVQDETRRAVEAIKQAEKSITDGEELSANAGEALNKIVAESQRASGQMAGIASATEEQAKGSQIIRDAMIQVSDMIERFAAASQEQAQSSEFIIGAVERMKGLASQVQNSTKEQTKTGKLMAKSTENITGMIQKIKRACDEQSRGSEQIVAAVEDIQQSAHVNIDSTVIMNDAAATLARQVELLHLEVQAFKV